MATKEPEDKEFRLLSQFAAMFTICFTGAPYPPASLNITPSLNAPFIRINYSLYFPFILTL